MKKMISLTLAAALLLTLMIGTSSALVIESGYTEPTADDAFGVRYRSFKPTGGDEVYLGVPDLGVSANRTAQNINWASESRYNFSFTYDPTASLLTSVVAGYSPLIYSYAGDIEVHTLKLDLVNRDVESELILRGLTINGEDAGDFSGSGWNTWMLSSLAPSSMLTVSGTIERFGAFSNSQELSKIELLAYGDAPVATPEPSTFVLLGAGLVGLIGFSRRRFARN